MFRLRASALLVLVVVGGCGGGSGTDQQPAGRLAGGQAHVAVTGDLHRVTDLPLRLDSVYSAAPGGMSLTFVNPEGDALSIGGVTFAGTRPTSDELSVTVTITREEPSLFVSSTGECQVSVGRADANGIDGSIECDDLANEAASIDVTASFSAST